MLVFVSVCTEEDCFVSVHTYSTGIYPQSRRFPAWCACLSVCILRGGGLFCQCAHIQHRNLEGEEEVPCLVCLSLCSVEWLLFVWLLSTNKTKKKSLSFGYQIQVFKFCGFEDNRDVFRTEFQKNILLEMFMFNKAVFNRSYRRSPITGTR